MPERIRVMDFGIKNPPSWRVGFPTPHFTDIYFEIVAPPLRVTTGSLVESEASTFTVTVLPFVIVILEISIPAIDELVVSILSIAPVLCILASVVASPT